MRLHENHSDLARFSLTEKLQQTLHNYNNKNIYKKKKKCATKQQQ